MAAGHFLLLVQEKVTKENTPSDPRRSRSERFAAGERVRPTGHPWPVVRIGAIPRAARASRGWSVHPLPLLRGDPKSKAKEGKKKEPDVSHISGVAYIRCFCGRDCRALLFRVPSRPRRAGGGNSRVPRTRARAGCAR